MKIAVIGCGFVGGTVADFLEEHCTKDGVEVVRIDPKIEDAPELSDVAHLDAAILCLNAPTIDNGSVDIAPTTEYIRELNNKFGTDFPILLKSTMPIFSRMQESINEFTSNVTYNPEFLTASNAKEDFLNQEHFIVGVDPREITWDIPAEDNTYARFWTNIFAPALPNTEFIYTDRETAAMVKYTHNAWLATKVTFFHALSESMPGLSNYDEMTDILAKFTNIGPSHMKVPNAEGGLGYGGFCFPKDMKAFQHFTDMFLVEEIIHQNDQVLKKKKFQDLKIKEYNVPEEDYIICIGTSHTLGECEGRLVKAWPNFVEQALGIKVVQVGHSGSDNNDLLENITELNNRGFFNERCKMVLLEPRITEGTVKLSLDTIIGKEKTYEYLEKVWYRNSSLARTNLAQTADENGYIEFQTSNKYDLIVKVGVDALSDPEGVWNRLYNEMGRWNIKVKRPKDFDRIIDSAVNTLIKNSEALLSCAEDIASIEAMASIVKNANIKFRWMLVDNRWPELHFLRFRFGQQSQIFKHMLLTSPLQALMVGNPYESFFEKIGQPYRGECGHFTELGNKEIADRFIIPAVRIALESDK